MIARGEQAGFLRAVRVDGSAAVAFGDEPVDVVIRDGVVADMAPTGMLQPAGAVIDGDGARLVPGLWDHHVHTVQWALRAQRFALETVTTAAEAAQRAGSAELLQTAASWARDSVTAYGRMHRRSSFWTPQPGSGRRISSTPMCTASG